MFKFITPWMFKKDSKYIAKAFFLFIFFKSQKHRNNKALVRHEMAHIYQQLELLFIFHWLLYLYFHVTRGYDHNPFEIAADEYQDTSIYKLFAWLKYV